MRGVKLKQFGNTFNGSAVAGCDLRNAVAARHRNGLDITLLAAQPEPSSAALAHVGSPGYAGSRNPRERSVMTKVSR